MKTGNSHTSSLYPLIEAGAQSLLVLIPSPTSVLSKSSSQIRRVHQSHLHSCTCRTFGDYTHCWSCWCYQVADLVRFALEKGGYEPFILRNTLYALNTFWKWFHRCNFSHPFEVDGQGAGVGKVGWAEEKTFSIIRWNKGQEGLVLPHPALFRKTKYHLSPAPGEDFTPQRVVLGSAWLCCHGIHSCLAPCPVGGTWLRSKDQETLSTKAMCPLAAQPTGVLLCSGFKH